MIFPVILSGGSGTRLWPVSTPERPKQFLPLLGTQSLFQQTLARVANRSEYGPPIVVANAAHEQLCRSELEDSPAARLILEPVARNTAVAIVMAAEVAVQADPSAIILVMPSDHRIGDEAAFHQAVAHGAAAAEAGFLVTFGVLPTGPVTGYGYLQAGDALSGLAHVRRVQRFKEKPDLEAARAMLAAGDHYWNGGIFIFRADLFLQACEQHAPEVRRAGEAAIAEGTSEHGVVCPANGPLHDCPDISVDYAVMERSDMVAMVPLDAAWSDVGSWDALADLAPAPDQQRLWQVDSRNCFVRSDGAKVALLGVDDLIVIAEGEQIVVMRRGSSQDIKRLATLVASG